MYIPYLQKKEEIVKVSCPSMCGTMKILTCSKVIHSDDIFREINENKILVVNSGFSLSCETDVANMALVVVDSLVVVMCASCEVVGSVDIAIEFVVKHSPQSLTSKINGLIN